MKTRREHLEDAKTIVVKVGTSTLTYENGLLNFDRIEKLVRQLSDLHNQGKNVVLVTSGAIGVGATKLGLKVKPQTIPEKQAAAAIGQGILLHIYEKFFSEYGQIVAQILLTKDDITNKTRYNNAQNSFNELLRHGVIPIVNENDAIAIHEIKVGDNDTLSALVASIVNADLLILLSDIDGLYDSDPRSNKNAKLLTYVPEITEEVESYAGISKSKLGTGGMATKLKAAKIAVENGVSMIIANGSNDNIIKDIISNNEVGTLFSGKNKGGEGIVSEKR
jgi:glutamate 5-kinase